MFRVSEVVRFAVEIEKNGTAFYRAAAGMAASPQVRQLLEELAAAEVQHIEDFSRLARGLESYLPPETYPGEYEDYVRVLVDNNVFTRKMDPHELLAGLPAEEDVLKLAMSLEKDSILFYGALRRLVRDEEARAIEELIRQEEGHLVQLARVAGEPAARR